MKFHITTLGCKVNQYESEQAKDLLVSYGHLYTKNIEQATLVIINTCSVTHIADRKSRQQISKALHINEKARIIVTGCTIENKGFDARSIPGLMVLKDNLLKELEQFSSLPQEVPPAETSNKRNIRKMIMIQNGCNYYCSYCIIPYVRSKKYSINPEQIIEKISKSLDSGIKEFVLTGINLGTYDYAEASLLDLLKRIMQIKGEFRLRISSIEPNLVSDEIIEYILENPRIAKHLHIPIQAATDSLLSKMNRKYTIDNYNDLLDKLQNKIVVTTDLIIGFPGETQDDFAQTIRLISSNKFMDFHLFPYSKRVGTKASEITGHISSENMKERMKQALVENVSNRSNYLSCYKGEILEVLVEQEKDGHYYGFSDEYIKVKIQKKGPELIYKFIKVRAYDVFEDTKASGILGEFVELIAFADYK